jgi:hypothetical protein
MKFILTLCLCCWLCCSYSQQSSSKSDFGIIIGNVIEGESGKAVPEATVLLTRNNDSVLKRQQVTDKNGSFEFERIPFGVYRLSISSVSFATFVLDSISIRDERFDFNLGDIKLNKSIAELEEVIVYAEKPLIENKAERSLTMLVKAL